MKFFKVCRFFYSATFYLFSSCLICGRTPGIDNQNDSMVDIFSEISIPGLLIFDFPFHKIATRGYIKLGHNKCS